MNERYIRQSAFYGIGVKGQEQIEKSRVAVIGLGALGTVSANNLARSGVGFLKIIDRDYVELNNLQRQTLYTEQDAEDAVPKAIAAGEHLKRINSDIEIEPIIADVNSSNIDSIIEDVDLVIDATDNFEIRMLINEACHQHGKPWIYGGVLGAVGMTMNFLPGGDEPCFCCLTGMDVLESGSGPTCATAGVLNTATGIIASLQCTEALKILTGSDSIRRELLVLDLWDNSFDMIKVEKDTECPICNREEYVFYGQIRGMQAVSLCGRDAVQVIPQHTASVDFESFAERLGTLGKVTYNRYTLDFNDGSIEIKLFKNGRAILKHVTDENRAKSLYTEYIGL